MYTHTHTHIFFFDIIVSLKEINLATLCLLIGTFNPFTFKVVIYSKGLAILLNHFSGCFVVLFFLLLQFSSVS